MLFVAVGSFVMLVIVVYLIASPVTRREPLDEGGETSALLVRKERLLSDIRDLDMDLATGKLEEQDHGRLRAALLVDAADTLKALEEAGPSPSQEPSPSVASRGPSEADDDARLEALIAARRRAIRSSMCPSCGAVSASEDSSCRRCGADLSAQKVG